MPPPRSTVPSYRLHKPTGQAVVTLRTATGGRRDIYLGVYNSEASRAEYARLVAAGPALALAGATAPAAPPNVTVAEVLVGYLKFADTYYVGHDGKHTSELGEYRLTCRSVRELFAAIPAVEFGPRKLATVRDRWVAAGLTRVDVNKRVAKVKRMFRWAAAEEMIPASVAVGLNTLIGLAKGRTPAPESVPITPVAVEHVEATAAHLRAEVAAMVRVQLYTGMRPGEVCRLRPADVDRSGAVWVFRPAGHKGTWRGKDRVVSIGPKAQELLKKLWPADPGEFVFSPRRIVAAAHAERSATRVTPRWPSHMDRNARKRKVAPKRTPAETYTNDTYRRAVERGIARANAARKKSAVADPHHGPNLPIVPGWAPNQLRHTHGTLVRKRFGLEAAQVVLGHSKADVTQVYAEKNLDLAAVVAAAVG